MFVRTDTELPVGAVVSVALELPDGEGPVPVHAKVIHVRTPFLSRSVRLAPGVGVQFVGADDTFRARVDQYIESIPRKSRVRRSAAIDGARSLRTHGWTQLLEREPGGSYCLTGALLAAAGEDEALYRRALRSIGERLNVPGARSAAMDVIARSWLERPGSRTNMR